MEVQDEEAIRVDVHLEDIDPKRALGDIRRGLLQTPRGLSPQYFYDDHGSQLFEQITEQPEYYQTRTERQLLNRIADAVVRQTHTEELVELGSGASSKTRVFLDAMQRAEQLKLYVPFDVSEGIVRRVASELVREYPGLHVHGVIGEFFAHLDEIPRQGRRLIMFLGGTIGNFEPHVAAGFLARVAQVMDAGEFFLLGVDLVKDIDRLEAAYNDAAGVTARFNCNILRVINRTTDGDFDPDAFEHLALYNEERHRVEMWLVSKKAQSVDLKQLGLRLQFEQGHRIHTEISVKYDRARAEQLLVASGLELVEWYSDSERLFALILARRQQRTTGA